jgi:hypothetical protein
VSKSFAELTFTRLRLERLALERRWTDVAQSARSTLTRAPLRRFQRFDVALRPTPDVAWAGEAAVVALRDRRAAEADSDRVAIASEGELARLDHGLGVGFARARPAS